LHLIWRLFCCCHQLIDNFVSRYKSWQVGELVVDIWSVFAASTSSSVLKLDRGLGLQLKSKVVWAFSNNSGVETKGRLSTCTGFRDGAGLGLSDGVGCCSYWAWSCWDRGLTEGGGQRSPLPGEPDVQLDGDWGVWVRSKGSSGISLQCLSCDDWQPAGRRLLCRYRCLCLCPEWAFQIGDNPRAGWRNVTLNTGIDLSRKIFILWCEMPTTISTWRLPDYNICSFPTWVRAFHSGLRLIQTWVAVIFHFWWHSRGFWLYKSGFRKGIQLCDWINK